MKKLINLMVILISVATVLSGAAQVLMPARILLLIGAEITSTTAHFFAIIGMFMVLFGAMMLHVIYSPYPNRIAIIWSAGQKLGASIAVAIGIIHGLFSLLAAGVAAFDFVSGLIFLYYLKSIKNTNTYE
jgi:hypothetical protein